MPYKRFKKKSNIKKIIKSMINNETETKTFIQELANTPLTNVGQNYDITSLAQGVGQNQRLGNSYKVTSFKLKGAVFNGGTDDLCRVIIYIPKNPSVLMPTDTSMQSTDPVDLDKFTVLSDRLIPVSDHGPGCKLYNKVCLFNKGRRNGLHVQFSDALATSITKNRLMVYMCSFSSAAPHPSFKGWWRVYFKDA